MAKSIPTLEWNAHEYEHKERSSDWFWAAGIITAGLALTSIIFGNVILGILVVVSAFSLALFINRPPENIHISINDEGLARGRVFYPFETLAAFWIDTDHPHKKVILRSKKMLMPLIVIPLSDNIDTERLRGNLSQYLKEEYHTLPLVEKILEYLGF
ncbi:hypothetical protein KW796_02300 [Candidatus Parcubacteria bacterium]|nr:hypothetical protein [Candidatus Parcubacteria bacterium]